MKKELFVDILDATLLPFIQESCPAGHRFMQDNDPKHTSGLAQRWVVEQGINWGKMPAESPDLNPIENLWHELKEYIHHVVKPKTKEEHVNGICAFWETVDVQIEVHKVHSPPAQSGPESDRDGGSYYWLLTTCCHAL